MGTQPTKDEGGGCDDRATTMSQDRRATRRDGPDCWCTRLAVAPDTGREELAAAAARDVGMDAGRGPRRQAQLQWGSETGSGWNLEKGYSATRQAAMSRRQGTQPAPPTPRLRVRHNSLVNVRHDSEVHAAALWWTSQRRGSLRRS